MTEADERWVMGWFRSLYTGLPEGRIEKRTPNWPDFVLTLPTGKTIGIEITEVINNIDSHRAYSTRNEITDLVLEKITSLLPFKFSFEIDLLPGGVRKSEKATTVNELVKICVEEFWGLKNEQEIELIHIETDLNLVDHETRALIMRRNFRNLPKGIKAIEIRRMDNALASWNPQGGGISVPNFSIHHLNRILNKKEPKITTYEPCGEYWLVIWEGRLPEGYFNKIELETPIVSRFDKVFMTRTAKQELAILKP